MSDFKTTVLYYWIFEERDKYYEYWKKESGYQPTKATESAYKEGFMDGVEAFKFRQNEDKK
jgi:hypothetical protein